MSSTNSNPLFCFEILKGAYVFHRHLFHDDIDAYLQFAGHAGSNIYYLVRAPKLRFVHDECAVDDQTLHCTFSAGQRREVKATIQLRDLFQFSHNLDIETYRFDVCVAPGQSDVPVLEFSPRTNLDQRLPIDISAILGSIDLDIGSRPEILYVGQSTDILNRWQTHKQINRALSMLSDDDELRLYFLHFQFVAEAGRFDDDNYLCLLDTEHRDSEEFCDRVSILEQTLILYSSTAQH